MYKPLQFTIKGASPLILHNGRLANPLDPIVKEMKRLTSKRKKTDEDFAQMAKLEWVGGLYTTEPVQVEVVGNDINISGGGKVCITGDGIEGMCINAAKRQKMGQLCKVGLLCDGDWEVKHEGSHLSIAELWESGQFTDIRKVKVQQASVMRCRPIFHNWSVSFTLQYLPDVLNEAQVKDIVETAGRMIGMYDYRPKYGRFEVAA